MRQAMLWNSLSVQSGCNASAQHSASGSHCNLQAGEDQLKPICLLMIVTVMHCWSARNR
jgi:hypothetical protein